MKAITLKPTSFRILFNLAFFFILTVLTSCESSAPKAVEQDEQASESDSTQIEETIAEPVKSKILGDFNGDGIQEEVMVIEEKQIATQNDHMELYAYTVKFTDKTIPALKFVGANGLHIINEGDLNDDGKDDISILNLDGESSWKVMSVHALTAKNWDNLVEFQVMYSDAPILDNLVLKNKQGGFLIHEMDMVSGKIITRVISKTKI